MAPDTVIKPATLRVMSRTLVFPKTCGTMVDTDFEHLCRQPLGAVDYLAIAKEFDIVFIRGRCLQTPSMFSHTHTRTNTHMHIHPLSHIPACDTRTRTHTHARARCYSHLQPRTHTHVHTHLHARTHTYVQSCTVT